MRERIQNIYMYMKKRYVVIFFSGDKRCTRKYKDKNEIKAGA